MASTCVIHQNVRLLVSDSISYFKHLISDRVSVILLQNLAIADLVILLTYHIPVLLLFTTRRWVLGDLLCFLLAHLKEISMKTDRLVFNVFDEYL